MKKSILFFSFISFSFFLSAQEIDSIIDIRDDQVYKVVKIGQQWWMRENLNIGTRLDGSQNDSDNGIIEKYCYNDSESHCNIYGGLYQWYEMLDYGPYDDYFSQTKTRGICPIGWYLPRSIDWNILGTNLGGYSIAGGKMKEEGTTHWQSPNTNATNESGFTALPGGYRSPYGSFSYLNMRSYIWSSTKFSSSIYAYSLYYNDSIFQSVSETDCHYGYSVRCLRDTTQFGYLTITDKNQKTFSKLEFTYGNLSQSIVLYNFSPVNTINISSIHVTNSSYELNINSAVISSGDSIHLKIIYNSQSPETYYNDSLIIESNDPYTPFYYVPLTAYIPAIDSIIDIRNNKVYGVVKIGQQLWMQENLNIGNMIDSTQNASDNGIIEKYCYRNSDSMCDIYGGLYQFDEMMAYNSFDEGNPGTTQGICPVGWHVSTVGEWFESVDYLGSAQGGKMKELGTYHWSSPNTGATNESGFNGLAGGYRDYYGTKFIGLNYYAQFWTSSRDPYVSDLQRLSKGFHYDDNIVFEGSSRRENGFSLRCIRDSKKISFVILSDPDLSTISSLEFYENRYIDTIIIINSSAGKTINISSIQTNSIVFSSNKSSAVLTPGDTVFLNITFNPPSSDLYYDSLTIESDDPYEPIVFLPLKGYEPAIDSIIDIRDNQVYKVVKIGQQWWMQENLNIGTRINGSQDATDNGEIEKYCYDDNSGNCDTYGGLYQWNEMMDYYPSDEGNPGITQGICPVGWHLPTDSEWTELTDLLGGWTIAGGMLKEAGTIHWINPNSGATNESGFTALPGDCRSYSGAFDNIGYFGNWWSSTEGTAAYAWNRNLDYSTASIRRPSYSSAGILRPSYYKEYGFSVRCLRDSCQFGYLNISDKNFRTVTNLNLYGDDTQEELIIINSGAGKTINISSIYTKYSVYKLNKSSSNLSPGDSIHLTITFDPPDKNFYPDTLFIESDDPYNSLLTIPLNGTFPPEIAFTDSTNISCFEYADGSATVTPSLGTPPYHYQWDDPGNTTDPTATGLEANIYYHVMVTDSLGWTVTDSIILSQPLSLTSQITDSVNISCFGYSDGTGVTTPSGGTAPYNYIWDDMAGATDSTVTGLAANLYYHVTITDANGCTDKDSVMLSEPAILLSSITNSSNISCYGFSDGSATVDVNGGTFPYYYLWDDQDATTDSTVTGLSANKYYHVTIDDAHGCLSTDSIMLSQPDALIIDITDSTNISCYDGSDGIAQVAASGGTMPYSYLWDNPGNSSDIWATGLSAGVYYHVNVTDAHSCPPAKDSVILSQPPLLLIDITDSTNISCYGFSDGIATVTPSGGTVPYTYLWDDTGTCTDSTTTGLSANHYYHVNVTDDHGCFTRDSIILSEPDPLEINPTYSDTICLNSSDGFISTNPSGGTAPYDYIWSNGLTSQTITGLEAGEYSVKVTDSHGCKDSANFTITSAFPYEEEKICIVTIDLATGKYLLIWEKTGGKGTENYNIYREGKVIGTVNYNDLSLFLDPEADPEKRPYLYKISAVDTCGNESGLSPFHKPIFLQYVSSEDGVNLTWSKYEIEGEILNFDSYAIYRGSDSITLTLLEGDIPTEVNVYTDNDPNALSRKYYYRVAGVLSNPCYPTGGIGKKAEHGPYSHSMSNIEDNRIQVTSENHSPTDIILDKLTIEENQAINILIGRLKAIDPDTIDAHTYSLVAGSGDTDNSSFLVSGDSLLTGEVFDFESKNLYSIRIRATDNGAGNLNYEKSFNIDIIDVVETGFEDVYRTNQKIYPNPFNESTTIVFNNAEGHSYTLYLTDLSGKVCRIVNNITSSKYVLEKRDLKEGFYFIELSGPIIYRGKIVIE